MLRHTLLALALAVAPVAALADLPGARIEDAGVPTADDWPVLNFNFGFDVTNDPTGEEIDLDLDLDADYLWTGAHSFSVTGTFTFPIVAADETADGECHWDSTGDGGVGVIECGSDGSATVQFLSGAHTGASSITLAGDVDGAADSNDLDELAVEAELEAVLDIVEFQAAGLTVGQALRATSADAFAFGPIDLGNTSAVTGTLPPNSLGAFVEDGDNTDAFSSIPDGGGSDPLRFVDNNDINFIQIPPGDLAGTIRPDAVISSMIATDQVGIDEIDPLPQYVWNNSFMLWNANPGTIFAWQDLADDDGDTDVQFTITDAGDAGNRSAAFAFAIERGAGSGTLETWLQMSAINGLALYGDPVGTTQHTWDSVGGQMTFTGGDLVIPDALQVLGLTQLEANLEIANGTTSSGLLTIFEDVDLGTSFLRFQAGNLTEDTIYTWPTDDNTAGHLTNDGAGVLTWEAAPAAGEVNTHSSDGGGLALTAATPKVGVDLRLVSLAAADFDVAADLVTIDAAIARLASPIFTGIVTLPSAAAPLTDADGEMAFDQDVWAAGRHALEFYNGTESVYVVAVSATDTPTNGQIPKFNTDGTWTFENDNTGTAGGVVTTQSFDAGSVSVDGISCFFPVEDVTNSGPKIVSIICDGTDAGEIEGTFVMPDGWDETENMEVYFQAYSTNASPSGVWELDFKTSCRADGAAINDTWGSEDNASITFATQYVIETSSNATPVFDGSCAQGSTNQRRIFWQAGVDDTASTSTQEADIHFMGIIVEYTWDQDDTL